MAEKLEDLNLPNLTVQKIIREALPENVMVAKDARSALSRAASVFILYVTSEATQEALRHNRKTISGQDIIAVLSNLEFDDFIEPLEKIQEEIKTRKQEKKNKDKKAAEEDTEMAEENDENLDESIEEEEDTSAE